MSVDKYEQIDIQTNKNQEEWLVNKLFNKFFNKSTIEEKDEYDADINKIQNDKNSEEETALHEYSQETKTFASDIVSTLGKEGQDALQGWKNYLIDKRNREHNTDLMMA